MRPYLRIETNVNDDINTVRAQKKQKEELFLQIIV
jgi:hypothetical protein